MLIAQIIAILLGMFIVSGIFIVACYRQGWWYSERGRRQRNWIAFKAIQGITLEELHDKWTRTPDGIVRKQQRCLLGATPPKKPSRFMLKQMLHAMCHQFRLHKQDLVYTTEPLMMHRARRYKLNDGRNQVRGYIFEAYSDQSEAGKTIDWCLTNQLKITDNSKLRAKYLSVVQEMFDDFLLMAVITSDIFLTDEMVMFESSILNSRIEKVGFMDVFSAYGIKPNSQ